MKSFSTPVHREHRVSVAWANTIYPAMAALLQSSLALLAAVVAATALVLLFVWLTGTEMVNLFGAGVMGAGLVFLGLAVDNHERWAWAQGGAGLALLTLAFLQAFVSPEYLVVSGSLLAVTVAVGLFRWLR